MLNLWKNNRYPTKYFRVVSHLNLNWCNKISISVYTVTFSLLTVPLEAKVSIFKSYKWFYLGLWIWQHWRPSPFLCLHSVSTQMLSGKVSGLFICVNTSTLGLSGHKWGKAQLVYSRILKREWNVWVVKSFGCLLQASRCLEGRGKKHFLQASLQIIVWRQLKVSCRTDGGVFLSAAKWNFVRLRVLNGPVCCLRIK